MPNGRPRSQKSKHANNKRNRERQPVISGDEHEAKVLKVSPSEMCPPIDDTVSLKMYNDMYRDMKSANSKLKKDHKKLLKEYEIQKTAFEIQEGEKNYILKSYQQFGKDMKDLGYAQNTKEIFEVDLEKDTYQPEMNKHGQFNSLYTTCFLIEHPDDVTDRERMDNWIDKTGQWRDASTCIQRTKDFGGRILTLDDLGEEIDILKKKLKDHQKTHNEFVELMKDKYHDIVKEAAEEVRQEGTNEISTQTDENYFYDNSLEGWAGF